MNPYRLLLVDDDEAFRERLARAMQKRGFETRTAPHAEAALEIAGHWKASHATVDLKMPGAGGLALVPRLRKIHPLMRIIVLTGYGSIATAVEAVRLGADDYLTKPTHADSLEAALLKCTGKVMGPLQAPSLERVEWEHLQRVLQDCGQNISQAARVLGIERRTLQRKLQKTPPGPP